MTYRPSRSFLPELFDAIPTPPKPSRDGASSASDAAVHTRAAPWRSVIVWLPSTLTSASVEASERQPARRSSGRCRNRRRRRWPVSSTTGFAWPIPSASSPSNALCSGRLDRDLGGRQSPPFASRARERRGGPTGRARCSAPPAFSGSAARTSSNREIQSCIDVCSATF